MKKSIYIPQAGYSIITAILTIGFLLVLTTSTFQLILQEMYDLRGRQDYLKAYAAAEGGLELALLQIKQFWYGIDDDSFQDKTVLSWSTQDATISYEFMSQVSAYSGTLLPNKTEIIPLFWIDSSSTFSTLNTIRFQWNDIAWNIISEDSWISWKGDFTQDTSLSQKILDTSDSSFTLDPSQVKDILPQNPYLFLYNPTGVPLSYEIQSSEGFTRPQALIFSQWKSWNFSQNLRTKVDNTEFLGMLQYSVYSWD